MAKRATTFSKGGTPSRKEVEVEATLVEWPEEAEEGEDDGELEDGTRTERERQWQRQWGKR